MPKSRPFLDQLRRRLAITIHHGACDYSTYLSKFYSRFANPLVTVISSSWDVYETDRVQGRRRTDCPFTGLSGLCEGIPTPNGLRCCAVGFMSHEGSSIRVFVRDDIPKTASRTYLWKSSNVRLLTHSHKLERGLS